MRRKCSKKDMKKHNFTKHRTIRDFGGDSKNGDITVDKVND